MYALSCASPFGYYLDSGEFVAQAFTLGISHPPGQALFGLYGRLCLVLFPGPYAFRLAIGQGLASAIAAAALFQSMRTVLHWKRTDKQNESSSWLALALTLLVSLSPAWMLQSQRPEVYALTNLCVQCAWREAILSLQDEMLTARLRVFRALLWVGVAATVHHLIALLALLPILLAALRLLMHERTMFERWRTLRTAAWMFCAGLLPFLYLPARALRASLALGNPSTLANLYWTLSAKAFHNTHAIAEDDPTERGLSILVALHEQVHLVGIFIALLGAMWTLRKRELRWLGGFLLLAAGPSIVVRALLGFVPGNPDALGYLMPAVAATVLFVGAAIQVILTTLAKNNKNEAPAKSTDKAATTFSFALLLGVLVHSALQRAHVDFSRLRTPETLAEFRLGQLPRNAVVFAHSPSTIFLLWGAASESQRVTAALGDSQHINALVVPIPLLGYPNLAEQLVARVPESRASILHTLSQGAPDSPSLEQLTTLYPTYVELDPRLPPEVYPSLAPSGFLYRVVDGGATSEDVRRGSEEQERLWQSLLPDLSADFWEPETRKQLAWICYNDALFYMERGFVDAAKNAVRRGLVFAPEDQVLLAMGSALAPIPVARLPRLNSSAFRFRS